MSIDYSTPPPTRLTIHPEPQLQQEVSSGWRKPIQKATLGDQTFEQMVSGNGSGSNTKAGSSLSFWGDDGFGLDDLIDLINPLQHIPIVSTIYRAITGDTIAAGPQLVGGAVLGGVAGAAIASAEIMFQQETGNSVGGAVIAALSPDETQAKQTKMAAKKDMASTEQRFARADLVPVPLQPSLEPLNFDVTGLNGSATLTAQDVAAAAAAMPLPVSASKDKNTALLDLYSTNRTQSQQAYAKTQSLIASQNAARDLKF